MREGVGESLLRHPDPAVFIRSKLGSLRMRFITVKDLGDCLTLLRGQRGDIDQRFHALLIGPANHCAGVGVSGYNHGTLCPGDRSVQRDDIVAERSEREGRSNNLQSLFAEKENDFLPARSIRPGAMNNNYRAVFREWHFLVSGRCNYPKNFLIRSAMNSLESSSAK